MKKISCNTCLSINRELFPLYKVSDGLNILYSLLQCDPEALKEGFLKDSTSWMVCWECKSSISNIKKFRDQICIALKQLTNGNLMEPTTRLPLETCTDIETEEFIDCGVEDIKKEDIDNQECIDNNTLRTHLTKDLKNLYEEKNSIEEEHDITDRSIKNKSDANDKHIRDEIEIPDDFDDSIEKEVKKKLKRNGESKVKKKRKIKSRKSNQILCTECGRSFETKGAKWKHIQIAHKEGHKCLTCGKIFSFKFNLQRHQHIHAAPGPLTPCPTCSKLVSPARLASHARTHTSRSRVACVPCRRQFVTRDTYKAHLKNSRAHAAEDMFRYPCQSCEKKYRSRGELRDHVAYKHDNQKQKCPVCEKYLATRRSLARHVRRAHEGVREGTRDKMCDYCGRTFRDKKSLCEHIWRHTGARPLACPLCPRTFRQRAALYEHTKRLHPNG